MLKVFFLKLSISLFLAYFSSYQDLSSVVKPHHFVDSEYIKTLLVVCFSFFSFSSLTPHPLNLITPDPLSLYYSYRWCLSTANETGLTTTNPLCPSPSPLNPLPLSPVLLLKLPLMTSLFCAQLVCKFCFLFVFTFFLICPLFI